MKRLSRVALTGAATAALALVAGPAFAVGPHMVAAADATASAPKPAVTITPAHLSAHQYAKTGIVAHLSSFPAGTAVAFGLGNGASGGPIAENAKHTTSAAGTLNLRYVPAKDAAQPATYTLITFYNAPVEGSAAASSAVVDPATAASVDTSFTVKASDAKVAWTPATRDGSSVTLGATVKRWSPKAHAYVAWKNAAVKFQEKVDGVWKTKATAHTNTKGVAKRTVAAKVHTWRALVVSTTTTWGAASQSHKK
jgi:hypothetical protein